MTEQRRITDAHIMQIATNTANIANVTVKMDDMDEKLDTLDHKLDEVIASIAAQKNQLLGASWLAKFLWFAFPMASAGLAWIVAKHT